MTNRRAVTSLAFAAVYCLVTPGIAAIVDFETAPTGTVYGGAAKLPNDAGDPVLTQNGITMSVETFWFDPFLSDFYAAEVVSLANDADPNNALLLDSISVLFNFSGVGFDVYMITLDVRDTGGTSNIAVNGADVHILDPLSALPTVVAPGVTALASEHKLTLVGETTNLLSLRIGGQELIIDNVLAVPDPTGGMLMAWGVFWLCRRPSSRGGRRRCRPRTDARARWEPGDARCTPPAPEPVFSSTSIVSRIPCCSLKEVRGPASRRFAKGW